LYAKKHYRTLTLVIILISVVGFGCQITGIPGEETPGILPTQAPGEPTAPPLDPTESPIEPEPTNPPEVEQTTPPLVESTSPPDAVVPPSDGDGGISDTVIQVLFWLLVLVVVILGIALIVSLFTGRKTEPVSQSPSGIPEETQSYAETTEEPQAPQSEPEITTVTALDKLSPQVAPLYDRFVNLLQGMGPVTILPTQSRVDFQHRIIFASVQFLQDEMRVQLVLPHRVDDPRMVRIEVFSEDKIAHTVVLRSTDDFDARFSNWLQESYESGS
jgi:hypothetical protein